MENALQDVNAVVGVSGSFVCDGEGQVLASALPGIFDETMLSNAGRTVAQTIAGLELTRRRKVGDLDLVYRGGRLVVKNLRVGYLCILCVPQINVPLLNLTANVAARKLAGQIKASQTGPVEMEKPAPHEARVSSGPTMGPTVNGTFFSRVEQELIRLMGPMAAFVLKEQMTALGEMREAFPRDKVHQLVEKLATEIEDEDKRVRFRQVALEILAEVA
jgi:predicted regulator of Ras-like GTPase activity (Roadblock/LC7/MglB family)